MLIRNYYQILGVEPQAGPHTIKSAYRRLARRYHPDVAKGKDAQARFLEIQEAYDALSDPAKRREYDRVVSPTARRRSSVRHTPPVRRGAEPPARASGSGLGFRFVLDILGIRVDAGMVFSKT